MVVKLPINSNPTIMTYSYYAFMDAVISSDYCDAQCVADIVVIDYQKEDWNEAGDQLLYEMVDDHLRFRSSSDYCGMNKCLYRTLRDDDSIEITIHSQLNSQPWGAINIFISDLAEDEIMEDDKYLFRMGIFNKEGLYTRVQNVLEKFTHIDRTLPISLSIKREGNKVSFGVKTQKGNWQVIKTANINEENVKPMHIGFQIKLNDSAYLNWKYSNFIQIFSDLGNPNLKIEYYSSLKKNWKCYINNYFLNFRLTKFQELSTWNISRLDFVRNSINLGKYVEIWLNYYFLKFRPEYMSRDDFHEYLVYGYSDSKKELYILGYNVNGSLLEDVISYDDFMNNRNICPSEDYLVEYEKELDGNTYELDIEAICEMIGQYLNSTNSTIYTNHFFPKKNFLFGISVYDGLMTDGGMKSLLYDRRIAFLIYEHKKCMKERLAFLRSRGIVLKDELFEQCDKLVVDTMKFSNVCRKYYFLEKTRERYEDLRARLSAIKMSDKAFMQELLLELTQNNEEDRRE